MTRTDDPRIVLQRIRNRLFEYFDAVATYEERPFTDPNELIVMWEDWVHAPAALAEYGLPIFSTAEQRALADFQAAWEHFCDATPATFPPVDEFVRHPLWPTLRAAAERGRSVFAVRGVFSEDELQELP